MIGLSSLPLLKFFVAIKRSERSKDAAKLEILA
jgi:hypothetical protein